MDGILSVNAVVLERWPKMINKEQLQKLKELDKPFIKPLWAYAEYVFGEKGSDSVFKKYLATTNLLAYRMFKWKDSDEWEGRVNG